MQTPCASVVLNTYNRSTLVRRAIGAVLAQSVQDIQLIVVDDGSIDDTPEVVAQIDDVRLTFIRQKNTGLSGARNRGAVEANAMWIAFLDDDDYVEPDWILAFSYSFGDDIGLIFSGYKEVSLTDGSEREHQPGALGGVFGNATGTILAGSWIIRRSVFEAVEGFRTDLPTLVQSEFLMRAIDKCHEMELRIESIPSTQFHYSVASWNDRPTLTSDLTIAAATQIMDIHSAAFNRDRRSRASWNSVIGVAAARLRRWKLARSHFLRAARARPLSPANWARVFVSCSPGRARVWKSR